MLSSTMLVFCPHVALYRGPRKISATNVWDLREVTPEDEGIVVNKGIAAPEAEAKRGRPKKDARAPEKRSEQVREGRN